MYRYSQNVYHTRALIFIVLIASKSFSRESAHQRQLSFEPADPKYRLNMYAPCLSFKAQAVYQGLQLEKKQLLWESFATSKKDLISPYDRIKKERLEKKASTRTIPMNRRHSFSQDRRPPATFSSQYDNNGSSNRAGVLRQFRPGISDAWLRTATNEANVGQGQDSSALRRIATTRPLPTSSGVLKDSQRNAVRSNIPTIGLPSRLRQNNMDSSSGRLSVASSSTFAPKLICPECLTVESNSVALRLHMQKKHFDSNVLLRCPHCAEIIKHMTNLHRHIRVSI